MKRVLFLAYLFPPIANSGTYRPLKFAKYLSHHGWDPLVMTASGFDGLHTEPALLEQLPASMRVIRVPMVNELLNRIVTGLGCQTRVARQIGAGLSWRLQARFSTPDLYALWRPTVRRAAINLFRREGFDAIYATGYPWTALLAGADISRATGRPLIADFRDPWAAEDLFRTPLHPPEHEARAGEAEVLRQASVAITVSPTLTRQLRAAHMDEDESKFVTIYNGFDPVDLDTPPPPSDGTFRIVYTGVWKDGYNPSPLYDVVAWLKRSHPSLLQNVEVIAAGFAPGEAERRGLADHIRERGILPHREAVALMRSADVLFLTNGEGSRQMLGLPSKLYEYLATGRPVLALTHPDGDAGRVLQRVGGALTLPADDPGPLFDTLAAACRTRRLAVPPLDRHALASFERVNLTRQLADQLDAALAGRRHVPHHLASVDASPVARSA